MVRSLAFVVLLSLLAVSTAQAQIFLELVGQTQGPILGDATFSGEIGRIEITSFTEGAYTALDPNTGAVISRTRQSLTITKVWDSSSVRLLRAQGQEEVLTTCAFRFYLPAGATTDDAGRRMPMAYLTVELTNARIESYSSSGDASSVPTETLTLQFDAIRYTYNSTGETFIDTIHGPGASAGLARRAPEREPLVTDGFEFELPEDGQLGIEITDADGNWVTTLYGDDVAGSGGVVRWEATDGSGRKVPAGVYTATVRSSGTETMRRMVVGG